MSKQVFGSRKGPAGKHLVVLSDVEEIINDIGPAYLWTFTIVEGQPHAGHIFERVTGRKLEGGTVLGDLLDAMYGRQLQKGDLIDPIGDHLGQEFTLVAQPSDNGASGGRFVSISPVKKEAK